MARNRMIKSDFPEDEKVGELSRNARLLFILSWLIADDSGVFRGSPHYIKNRLFPYDNISTKEITTWLGELTTHGVLTVGSCNSETYYFIKNFLKHQVISRPSKFRYVLSDYQAIFKNTHGVLTEYSLMKVKVKEKEKGITPNKSADSLTRFFHIASLLFWGKHQKELKEQPREDIKLFLGRHGKAIKQIVSFSDGRIYQAMKRADQESRELKYEWSAETVLKKIEKATDNGKPPKWPDFLEYNYLYNATE